MSDFLFELGVEELPVAAVQELSTALLTDFQTALTQAKIPFGEVQAFGAPRRLALFARDVAAVQPSQQIMRRGPTASGSLDSSSPAVLGFAKSCGVDVEALEIQTTEKGSWWTYQHRTPEISTITLLPTIIQTILKELPIRKLMRWGTGELSFCRPVHWAIMLWGNELLETEILGVKTGRVSFGHRFHHPQPIEIHCPNDYAVQLKTAHVIANFQQRRALITEQITQLAAQQNLQALVPEALLNEVTAIVEWPHALIADFDPKFLKVPSEALIAAMQNHQKSFALYTQDNKMAPHFIAVANIDTTDLAQVKKGNEKVMQARLADAAFFYHQDQTRGLATLIPALKNVVFQTELGSLADKSIRISKIIQKLQPDMRLNPLECLRAAELSKCDLLTGMVGEFPELQGIMGYYYALNAQEAEPVALALKEQYWPRFSQDTLPSSALGQALSLADRLDTLYGLFAIGQKPTGVKDPFKLRRHALAIARILLDIPRLSLRKCLDVAAQAYAEVFPPKLALMTELETFILERLQSYYQNQTLPVEIFQAVRTCQADVLADMGQRIAALQRFITQPQAYALIGMAKRIKNVIQQAEKQTFDSVNPTLFVSESERALWSAIEEAERCFNSDLDYDHKLQILYALQPKLTIFFDDVLVMDPDLKLQLNRLGVLTRLQVLLSGIADLSHLVSLTK